MPDAILPAGTYEIQGEIVQVNVNLISDDKVLKVLTIEGNKNDLVKLADAITKQIIEASIELKP